MNFLAHLFLSCEDEDLMIGNFIADFIKNKEVKTFKTGVQRGIKLHREIDSFTDNHTEVRKGTARLQPNHHKYSPVIIDVFYDYLLSKNWSSFTDQKLEDFVEKTYEILERRMNELPESLKKILPRMIADDWLMKYGKLEGIEFVLGKMDERTSFPSNFKGATKQLEAEYEVFKEEFMVFFPEVIALAEGYLE